MIRKLILSEIAASHNTILNEVYDGDEQELYNRILKIEERLRKLESKE